MPHVTIMATSLNTFAPNSFTFAGPTLDLTLTNNDTEAHTFVLSSWVNQPVDPPCNSTATPGNWFTWHHLLAEIVVNASGWVNRTLTFAQSGSYQFIDRAYFSYPWKDGMSGNLTVSALPNPPPTARLKASSLNAFDPTSIMVQGPTLVLTIWTNDTEAHSLAFSSQVNHPVNPSVGGSRTSGGWFTWPNLLAETTVNASAWISITLTFPYSGVYQYIDRVYYGGPENTGMGGNITVSGLTAPPASSTTTSGSFWASPLVLYSIVGAVVLLVVVGAVLVMTRWQRRTPPQPTAAHSTSEAEPAPPPSTSATTSAPR